jgi:hypothetical protein
MMLLVLTLKMERLVKRNEARDVIVQERAALADPGYLTRPSLRLNKHNELLFPINCHWKLI